MFIYSPVADMGRAMRIDLGRHQQGRKSACGRERDELVQHCSLFHSMSVVFGHPELLGLRLERLDSLHFHGFGVGHRLAVHG
jgi:hypothetical protein